MGVGVESGPTWAATAPAPLFEGRYFAGAGNPGRTYDILSDARRFLMIKLGDEDTQSTAAPASLVVQNWVEELKRLVPRP